MLVNTDGTLQIRGVLEDNMNFLKDEDFYIAWRFFYFIFLIHGLDSKVS